MQIIKSLPLCPLPSGLQHLLSGYFNSLERGCGSSLARVTGRSIYLLATKNRSSLGKLSKGLAWGRWRWLALCLCGWWQPGMRVSGQVAWSSLIAGLLGSSAWSSSKRGLLASCPWNAAGCQSGPVIREVGTEGFVCITAATARGW